MPHKSSTIKIKSRKLKAPEPETDEETIIFDSQDEHSQSESESDDQSDQASRPPTPKPASRKPGRPVGSGAGAKASARASDRSSTASKASKASHSTAKQHGKAKAAATHHAEQKKMSRAERQAADAAYAAAIKEHAETVKASTRALKDDYKAKQNSLADTHAERLRLMSRLVL
jgi:hypothetical protein